MKIAIFTDSYWPRINGITVSVDYFSYALAKMGHDIIIVCPEYPTDSILKMDDKPTEDYVNRVKVLRTPSNQTIFSSEDFVLKKRMFFWVAKQLDDFKPDIIHVNCEVSSDLAFNYAARRKIPVTYTLHTIWEDYVDHYLPLVPSPVLRVIVHFWRKAIFRGLNSIIVPSVQIQDFIMKEHRLKIPCYIIPTGIDKRLFIKSAETINEAREKFVKLYPKLKNKKILLFVGRISNEKNVSFILDIAPRVLEKHPEATFVLAGDGQDFKFYNEEAAKRGLEGHFTFTGFLSRQDVSLIYNISSIFIQPSRTETQGLVTIEAMMSGLPVVAIGAMGTINVMGGDNGGFMTRDDKDEFTRRIFDLLEDEALYKKKSAEARSLSENWTIEKAAAKLETAFVETMERYN